VAASSWRQVGDPDQVGSARQATVTGPPVEAGTMSSGASGGTSSFGRVASRDDKRAVNCLAWVSLAAALLWR
jgi:hypothetical protein